LSFSRFTSTELPLARAASIASIAFGSSNGITDLWRYGARSAVLQARFYYIPPTAPTLLRGQRTSRMRESKNWRDFRIRKHGGEHLRLAQDIFVVAPCKLNIDFGQFEVCPSI
jgi:hypothetical protein